MKSLVYVPVFAVLIFTLSTFAIQDAYAVTAVLSGNWNDPATWGGSVPAENDPKTIPPGITVTILAGDTIDNNNTIDNSGFLDIYGTLNNKNSGIVNNFGDIVINPGGTIINKPTGLIENSGTVDNSGIVDNSGTVNNFSTLANNDTILNNSGGTIENFGFVENFGFIENSGTFNNSGGAFNIGTFNNHCGATYTGSPLSPNPANNTCSTLSTPPFSTPFPIFAADSICTPLIMNTDTMAIESWFVKAGGGPLTIEVIAQSVNNFDPETVNAAVYDPSNVLVGSTTVSYPGGTPVGVEFSSTILIPGTIAGDIYRIDITTPSTPPTQPHYRLKLDDAMAAGISSPTFSSIESEPVSWILNVNTAENLNVDFFTDFVPTPATTVTYTLISPMGAVTTNTVPIIPGDEIFIPLAPSGAWILEVQSIDGHYRLDKSSGFDDAIYVSAISKLECNPTDLDVGKTGPATITPGSIIPYNIHVENVGTKAATDILVTDTIPIEIVSLSLVSASPICGPLSGGQIHCDVGDLAPGNFFDIFINLQTPLDAPSGLINNNAMALSTRPDINPANNNDVFPTLVLSGGPTISISDATVTEGHIGASTMTFTVSLSSPSSQTVTVNFATQDISAKTTDNDYVGTSGMLTFLPNEVSKPIEVTINGDRDYEPNETFYVNLTNPANAAFLDNQGIGIIFNDDIDPFIFIPVNMGGIGTRVSISGFDFTPGSFVLIKFDESLVSTQPVPFGDFNYQLTIQPTTPGLHTITATDGEYQSSSVFNVAAPRLTATDTLSSNNILSSASPGSTLNLYMKGFAANDPLKMITVSLDGNPVGSPVSPNKVGSYKAFQLTLPPTPASQYLISATDGTNTISITLVGLP